MKPIAPVIRSSLQPVEEPYLDIVESLTDRSLRDHMIMGVYSYRHVPRVGTRGGTTSPPELTRLMIATDHAVHGTSHIRDRFLRLDPPRWANHSR